MRVDSATDRQSPGNCVRLQNLRFRNPLTAADRLSAENVLVADKTVSPIPSGLPQTGNLVQPVDAVYVDTPVFYAIRMIGFDVGT